MGISLVPLWTLQVERLGLLKIMYSVFPSFCIWEHFYEHFYDIENFTFTLVGFTYVDTYIY